jgi:hypothetical protein
MAIPIPSSSRRLSYETRFPLPPACHVLTHSTAPDARGIDDAAHSRCPVDFHPPSMSAPNIFDPQDGGPCPPGYVTIASVFPSPQPESALHAGSRT